MNLYLKSTEELKAEFGINGHPSNARYAPEEILNSFLGEDLMPEMLGIRTRVTEYQDWGTFYSHDELNQGEGFTISIPEYIERWINHEEVDSSVLDVWDIRHGLNNPHIVLYIKAKDLRQETGHSINGVKAHKLYVERYFFKLNIFQCIVNSRYGVKAGNVLLSNSSNLGHVVKHVVHDSNNKFGIISDDDKLIPFGAFKLITGRKIKQHI